MFDQLAPTGEIRIAIAVGPTKSAVWTMVPEGGSDPEGVTVDMARRISEITGLPVRLVALTSSSHIIETADDDIWDLSFAPVDEVRRRSVDFGEGFHRGESTYLVRSDSGFRAAHDLHKSGATIIGVAGTATLRSAEAAANGAEVVGAADLPLACAMFSSGRGDALALGRLALNDLISRLPETRIVEGNFHVAETAVAVPKGKGRAIEAASKLVQNMKDDGTISESFARHGLGAPV